MTNPQSTLLATILLFSGVATETCEAGPLLDWLRGWRNQASYNYQAFRGRAGWPPVNRQTAYNPAYGNQAYSPTPAPCTTVCPKTAYRSVNRVVANYVPYTAFRTEWYRVPVTYYRPVTSSNPQTGCVSTCMRPCTTYQMQARRVPYTTYQTVYRTVQQRIPYTTYVTSYSAGGVPGCSSCSAGGTPPATPGYGMPAATPYGLNTNQSYGSPAAPANSIPQLSPSEITPDSSMQRPDLNTPDPTPDPETNLETGEGQSTGFSAPNNGAPATRMPAQGTPASSSPAGQSPRSFSPHNFGPQNSRPRQPSPAIGDSNRTASLIRGEWSYSPVQHAGYVTSQGRSSASAHRVSAARITRNSNQNSAEPFRPAFRNTGWKNAGWKSAQ